MKSLLFAGLFITTSLLASGDRGGNGGGGHVCGDKVELYDFYEGRSPLLHNLKLWESDSSISTNEYLRRAIDHVKKVDSNFGQFLDAKIKEIQKIPYNNLVLPVEIPRIADADIPLVDEGCEYLQVANWNDRFDRVYFGRKLFERMNSMNKAGLILHEALYKIARHYKHVSSSDKIRELVAKIFSDEEIKLSFIQENVLEDGRIAYLPKSGLCEITAKVSTRNPKSGNGIRIDLGLNGEQRQLVYVRGLKGLLLTKIYTDAPGVKFNCEDILEKGISGGIVYAFNSLDAIDMDLFLNGKRIMTSYSVKSSTQGITQIPLMFDKEDFFLVEN